MILTLKSYYFACMKAASLNELKKELLNLEPNRLVDICLRITKYKKENKELLTYLLFEADDEQNYIESIKELIDEQFDLIPKNNLYQGSKMLRKTLRTTNKFIKYSGQKETEAELLIYFCRRMRKSGLRILSSTALTNLYQQQLKKINKAIEKLHEDLQFDYQKELDELI